MPLSRSAVHCPLSAVCPKAFPWETHPLLPPLCVTGLDEGEVCASGVREVAQGTWTARTTTGQSTAAPLCGNEGRLKIWFSAEAL